MSRSTEQKLRLTVGQALVRYLQAQYSAQDDAVQRLIPGVFGIFGHGNVSGLGQALYEDGSELPYYQPRNEQGMVHAAAGFAKASRRLSTLACTTSIGPGAANMLTAAAGATINRLPVLLLPSDYYATRFQGPVLQQIEHPVSADVSLNDCFRPVSRFFDRISRPEQLLTALPEAMRVLTDPAETGAVTLSLPQDVQTEAYDYPAYFFERRLWRVERRAPDPRRIEEATALLAKAKRPVIIAGGGVLYSNASAELASFSETLGIPVGETTAGKGSIKGASAIFLGGQGVQGTPAAAKVMSRADLVICVGTRLSDFTTASHSLFQDPRVKFIGINLCSRDAFKVGALPIVADAREALKALAKSALAANIRPRSDYVNEVAEEVKTWRARSAADALRSGPGEPMSEGELTSILFQESKPGDVAVGASSGLLANLFKLWDASQSRSCYLEFGFSCMGFELPAGLGARMARPEGEVFVLMGDGTYLMNPMELVTAVQEDLKVTVIVAENHGFQCILGHQMHRAGHSFGNEFRRRDRRTNRLEGEYLKIDYAKNAESLGARAWHVKSDEELRLALREARQETRPCVVVVETGTRPTPGSELWWDVSVAEVSRDAVTQKLRHEYEQERNSQRFYY
jgi:3D-(3,5/4)-trihydroxycyclohexane-1,2-dione acylhydrolase (decyclizing)